MFSSHYSLPFRGALENRQGTASEHLRVLRFQRFLQLSGERADLARLALDAGYADQAHLTRETRRLSGRTPAELVASGAGPAGERVRSVQAVGAPGAYRPAG